VRTPLAPYADAICALTWTAHSKSQGSTVPSDFFRGSIGFFMGAMTAR